MNTVETVESGTRESEGGRPVVRADAVTREYRVGSATVRAVDRVSMEVRRGEFLAVTGPSGSGKSTLLHLLGGVDTPTGGRVLLDGRDLGRMSEREREKMRLHRVGLVFQRFYLLPALTARENVELPMAEAGSDRAERRERAGELLARVGLGDRTDHRPPQLSGGQRQRVAIARALSNRPALLLADEPTGELDRETSRDILELFLDLTRSEETTLVVGTHDAELAEGARRRLRLVDGRLAT